MHGSGYRVEGLGLRVQGSGFRVQGLEVTKRTRRACHSAPRSSLRLGVGVDYLLFIVYYYWYLIFIVWVLGLSVSLFIVDCL